MSGHQTISVQQLAEQDKNSAVDLIDVRTPVEYREVHAETARNIPLDTLDPQAVLQQRNGNADQPLYIICKTGNRGAKAQQKFIDAGFDNVINVDGGTDAWVQAGLPVKRGKKAISLERQVRIAAGFLVLVGALLAIFVNRYFAGLAAFVGAGLMFAGITNTCGMGLLLAKMPWNRVSQETGCGIEQ